MKNIIERSIKPVEQFNNEMRAKGNYTMVMSLGNGSMCDEPRKRGYVVSKKHRLGGSGSYFIMNYEKALEWLNTDCLIKR